MIFFICPFAPVIIWSLTCYSLSNKWQATL